MRPLSHHYLHHLSIQYYHMDNILILQKINNVIIAVIFRCRRALQHVLMHTKHRKSFGLPLISHPLMKNLVADLCLEAEAQTLTALYFSAIFDAANHDYILPSHLSHGFANSSSEAVGTDMMELFRIGVAVGKYWVTKVEMNFFLMFWSPMSLLTWVLFL